jgi:transposase
MKLHGNARTCPRGRRLLVERVECGWPLRRAAAAAGISERTAAKWCARWRFEGERGLVDRSSRPRFQPRRTPPDRVEAVVRLRRLRMTAAEIAEVLGMALSTVSLILKRSGLGRRSRLEPLEPVNRYEHQRPGELVHLDVKKLARFDRPDIASWAAVADASRRAPATSTCMSASTTTAASSMSNCSMTGKE